MSKITELGVRRKKSQPQRTTYRKLLPDVGLPYPEAELETMRTAGTYPDHLPVPHDLRPDCQGLYWPTYPVDPSQPRKWRSELEAGELRAA